MTDPTQIYQQIIRQRHPYLAEKKTEKSYKCLCCRDYGFLPADVIRRYLPDDQEQVANGPSASPIACTRKGCNSFGFLGYPEGTARDGLSPGTCQHLHDSELKRLQSENLRIVCPVDVGGIGRDMPAAYPADLARGA